MLGQFFPKIWQPVEKPFEFFLGGGFRELSQAETSAPRISSKPSSIGRSIANLPVEFRSLALALR
jgi:hypothetical protein